jgi:hypothetical protein
MIADEQIEQLAGALGSIATQLMNLGNGNASTQMGAIENLSKEVMEGTSRIAEGLHAIAEAISEHGGSAR